MGILSDTEGGDSEEGEEEEFQEFQGKKRPDGNCHHYSVARVIQGGCEIIGGEKLIIFQRQGKNFAQLDYIFN